jgi:hypothetical protein
VRSAVVGPPDGSGVRTSRESRARCATVPSARVAVGQRDPARAYVLRQKATTNTGSQEPEEKAHVDTMERSFTDVRRARRVSATNQPRSSRNRTILDGRNRLMRCRRAAGRRSTCTMRETSWCWTPRCPALRNKTSNFRSIKMSCPSAASARWRLLKDYAIHRQERGAINFARSVSLPCQVDTDKVAAQVKDGLLTVTMEKSKEAQPRQITIKAS